MLGLFWRLGDLSVCMKQISKGYTDNWTQDNHLTTIQYFEIKQSERKLNNKHETETKQWFQKYVYWPIKSVFEAGLVLLDVDFCPGRDHKSRLYMCLADLHLKRKILGLQQPIMYPWVPWKKRPIQTTLCICLCIYHIGQTQAHKSVIDYDYEPSSCFKESR